MKRLLYNTFCYTDVLINKTNYYLRNNDIETYLTTERMFQNEDTIIHNLYNLSTSATKILDRLYIGNAYNARDYYTLKNNNVGLIINCTKDIDNFFDYTEEFIYHRVPVKDMNKENILLYIHDTVDLIEKYLSENIDKTVLIHCFMGSSRSATILSALLIKLYHYTRRNAIGYIKEKRDIVNPNVDFFIQLGEYEAGLKA